MDTTTFAPRGRVTWHQRYNRERLPSNYGYVVAVYVYVCDVSLVEFDASSYSSAHGYSGNSVKAN